MNLHRLSIVLMIATLGLMAWTIQRGMGMDAFYQFLLGATIVVLIRRWHEGRAAKSDDAANKGDDGR